MAGERIRKNATVEIGIIKMTEKDFEKSIKRIENDITLAKDVTENGKRTILILCAIKKKELTF